MDTIEVTRSDCYSIISGTNADAVFDAYVKGDILALGRMAKDKIERDAAIRVKYEAEQRAKYRAEILAEAGVQA